MPKRPGFQIVGPRAISISEETLVHFDTSLERQFPLLVQPAIVGVNLTGWARSNVTKINELLARYGALLFRGFAISDITQFEEFAHAITPELIEYGERSSPRTRISARIYSSTDHPPDQSIVLHNEQSYTLNWPMKIWFYCAQPATQGGRTPIADSRKIYLNLSERIIERFAQKQVLYIRRYGDGFGLSWQEAFQTNDKAEVERQCNRAGIELEWENDNCLRTKQIRPAVRKHPHTGEMVWFNHAYFFNPSSLSSTVRDAMRSVITEEHFPFNTFYGDGSPIEPDVLDEIGSLYERESVSFDWQFHDILMLDNMLTAHGRESFSGPRKIMVAMGQPFDESHNMTTL